MKPLGIGDIRVRYDKSKDAWETWVAGAPKGPMSGKPLRYTTTKASSEHDAREKAFEHFAPVYPVLMITGEVHFKTAIVACVEQMRNLGQLDDETAGTYLRRANGWIPDKPKTPIGNVTKNYLEDLYAELHKTGGVRGKGLSVASLRMLNAVISKSYQYMIDHGADVRNPASRIKYPQPNPDEIKPPRVFSESEMEVFRKAIEAAMAAEEKDDRDIKRKAALFGSLVALHTGMRSGEVCALKRGDIRQLDDVIRVVHTYTNDGVLKPPKRGSRRSVVYDTALKAALRDHFAWQATYLTEKQRQSDSTPICCDSSGQHIKPRYMSSQFKKLCIDAGIDLGYRESFHLLRHTHATELLASGASVKAVQSRMGHARAATTLDIYAHTIPGEDAAIAAMFGEITERARKAGDFR